MASAGTTKAIKYGLIAINVIILLSGLIMLISGSVVQGQINSQFMSKTINGYSTQAGSIICIIFGILIMLMSSFGLYSTVKDQHRFLFLYSGIMSLVFIIQFITGVTGLGVKNSSKFDTYVKDEMEHVFNTSSNLNKITIDERDKLQEMFKCCGWSNFKDYKSEVPSSCCIDKSTEKCTANDIDNHLKNYREDGCATKITFAFSMIIETACGILVTFSLFNLISIVLSILLARSIKSGYQYT